MSRTGHVEVKGAYYSVPPGITGPLAVQWDERHVRVLDSETHTLLVEHERVTPGEHILSRSRPRHKPLQCLLLEAARHGTAVATLCNILAQDAEVEQPGAPISLQQIDPLIRELTNYRDVIKELTGDTV